MRCSTNDTLRGEDERLQGGPSMSTVRSPAPIYLLAGGPGSRRAHNDPLLIRAIAGSGVAEPSIAYVGAASGDDKSFFKMLAGLMRA
jgi:hypothetical protein